LLHLAQQQDGYVTNDAIKHIAELVGATSAEVLGTATFYEMFKFEPVGKFVVNICGTMSCALLGADELMHHAENKLGIKAGSTTPDGMFTLEHAECQAACTEAPCLQINYRYRYRVTPADLDKLFDDLSRGRLDGEIPPHGTVARVRQHIPSERAVGAVAPTAQSASVWMPAPAEAQEMIGTTYPHAPGFVAGDRPRSSRHGSSSTTRTRSTVTCHRRLQGFASRWPSLQSRSTTTSRVPPCSAGRRRLPGRCRGGSPRRRCGRRYLVVNGDESEPGTYKDRLLMELDPHQLIEGCLIACYAAGLSQCFLYIRGEMAMAQERVAAALNEAYAAGYIGKNILGTNFSVDIVLHWGAGAYVVGEETALIESLEGNRGMPRLKPPYFPAAIGLYGKPTIVNNVETLANLPWLMVNGVEAYTAIGTPTSPGTRMVAVSGHVKRPGVFEIVNGTTTFRDLLYGEEFCGGIRDDNQLKAFVPGGGSAPWFLPEQLDLAVREQVGQCGRIDVGIRGRDGDGRDHRHPRRRPHPHSVLRARIMWQVCSLSRRRHLAGTDHAAHRRGSRHYP
jgi:NADH-quinone oxidoreductase E subunit